MIDDPLPDLPPGAFAKQDTGDDLAFYAPPRLVTHIDEGAVAALTACYRSLLPENGRVFDLMSSWVSHLPDDRHFTEVVGHGMNAEELGANPRLTRWFIRDLNRNPALPLDDQAFDAVLCCVGVQYLQHPVAVFTEVRRVLAKGAQFIVSFSNRCFPTKAVAIWRALHANGHAELVQLYMERAGFSDVTLEVLTDWSSERPARGGHRASVRARPELEDGAKLGSHELLRQHTQTRKAAAYPLTPRTVFACGVAREA